MKKLLGKSIVLYLKTRYKDLLHWSRHPHSTQKAVLERLLMAAKDTQIGKTYHFDQIKSSQQFRSTLPLLSYEQTEPYIDRMMRGERGVLWPGQINWYAKSSGTTNQKSKYLPVTKEFMKECLIQGTWDTLALLYHHNANPNLFENKTLVLGGSIQSFPEHPSTKIGDISAIMLTKMPLVSRPFSAPDIQTATMPDWNEKIEKTARMTVNDPHITTLSGVPTWNIVLFRRIMELAGTDELSSVWPDFTTYIHGGVNFKPYKQQFRDFFPNRELIFQEVYNASEGYFASQASPLEEDMLLLLDNGIYYEFIPVSELESENPIVLSLSEVEVGETYALVISTNAGLYRYNIGDTVSFTSTDPYKIIIKGRTKQFINAFGEEVMIHNADAAIERACAATNSELKDYTAAPVYLNGGQNGRHQWLIEFRVKPENLDTFVDYLDTELKKINSDYEAKRTDGLALEKPEVIVLPEGSFENWLRSTRSISAQTKVPRLHNDRKIVDQILDYVSTIP